MRPLRLFGVTAACFFLAVVASSCTVVIPDGHGHHGHGNPPAHAPAVGHGVMHTYVYYPSSYVYYDTSRGTYFYMAGGVWKATAVLPSHIVISTGEGISLRLDTPRPYDHFHAHKAKYPPGQMKKAGAKPGKGKGRN